MQIPIRDILAKKMPVQIRQNLDVAHLFKARNDAASAEPLQIDVQAKYVAGIVEVAGELTLPLEFSCSRCLARFCRKLRVPFKQGFAQDASKVDEDSDDIHLVSDDHMEITPYVEEAVLLEIPFVPLCKEDCRGLNQSGVNLNAYPDAPQGERIDPRLAALADFFEKQ